MPGRVTFNVNLTIQGAEEISEISERIADLRPAFDVIVEKWARGNEDKFRDSLGAESSGAQIDPTVFWQGLTPSTMRSKRRKGQSDQIMVATGDLKRALTDPDLFFSMATATDLVFGTPKSIEEEMKVYYNWNTRQAIFLGGDDQRMIEETVQSYLSLGEDFKAIRFAQGLENIKARNQSAEMEIEFEGKVNS